MGIIAALLLAVISVQLAPSGVPANATSTAAPAVASWLTNLAAVRYPSKSGASVTLATAIRSFSDTESGAASLPPTISLDSARGLIDVCFEPRDQRCGFSIILRASDVAPPPAATHREISDPTIGITLAKLIARLHADPNFAGKNLITGAGGVVVLVQAFDEDPPPSRYDHGLQDYFLQDYFLRDGIVVARAFKATEN